LVPRSRAEAEALLEEAADSLLMALPPDHSRPFTTSRQLDRRVRDHKGPPPMDEPTGRAGTDAERSLRFMMETTRLNPAERVCMEMWIDGYSQAEMGRRLAVTQQRVSKVLRGALCRALRQGAPSFEEFSRRCIYRRPHHGIPGLRRACRTCGDAVPTTVRSIFCSEACRSDGRPTGPAGRDGAGPAVMAKEGTGTDTA